KGCRLARNFPQRAKNRNGAGADLDQVAGLRLKLEQQRLFDYGAPTRRKIGSRLRRIRLEVSIKRKVALNRANLREPGAARFWEEGHRGQGRLARFLRCSQTLKE